MGREFGSQFERWSSMGHVQAKRRPGPSCKFFNKKKIILQNSYQLITLHLIKKNCRLTVVMEGIVETHLEVRISLTSLRFGLRIGLLSKCAFLEVHRIISICNVSKKKKKVLKINISKFLVAHVCSKLLGFQYDYTLVCVVNRLLVRIFLSFFF